MRPEITTIPEDALEFVDKYTEQIDSNTQDGFTPLWTSNIRRNVGYFGADFIKSRSLHLLKNKYDGTAPVYMIGAGPSLKEHIEVLKKKDGIKICCSHALKFCLDNGLKPDYVIVIDAKEEQVKFLDDTRITGIPLITDIAVNHDALRTWMMRGGKLYFFRMSTFKEINEVIDSLIDFHYEVTVGGSIMSFAPVLAEGMGFKRCVFIGVDFTFDNGKVKFADGTESDYEDVIDACDINGIHAHSLLRMYIYKIFIETVAMMCKKIEFINAAGRGVLGSYIQGNLKAIRQIPLKEI